MPALPKSDAIASSKTKSKSKSKSKSKLSTSSTTAAATTTDGGRVAEAGGAAAAGGEDEKKDFTHAYADDLRADIYPDVNANPKAKVHTVEWNKIMNGACFDRSALETSTATDATRGSRTIR